jgi:inhibitor of cysteine peptidase
VAKLHRIVILTLVGLPLVLAGCARATEAPPQGEPTSTTPPDAQEDKVITGTARVEAIEILILESFPVQVNVVARGNLPDGCTTIDCIEWDRQDARTTSEWSEATGSGATVTRCAGPRAVEERLAFMACDR